ncbi:CidA/LrgA family protein [Vibrio palustris]|uniref:Holin-like protein CidA n=1 Tax=Vibrio palustris TaxID=1918946 RepID=A0A1R4B257_9VIBR|nr:CidA/LrgA family protein [Vibrio palustris]SJL82995.1 Holin-like protein CidA [Vibrio palustris]
MPKTLLQYCVSFALIYLCLIIGNWIQNALDIAIPGSIFGMLVLFALLVSGIAPVNWVKPGCHFFIRYMMLLFVPISVGLMDHFDLMLNNAWAILASAIGGTLIVLLTSSVILDKYITQKEQQSIHKERD